MNRRQALLAVGSFLALALLMVFALRPRSKDVPEPPEAAPVLITAVPDDQGILLFFPDGLGTLTAEVREVDPELRDADLLSVVVTELLAGPRTEALFAPFAEEVTLTSLFVDEDGVVYIDFASHDPRPASAGSRREILTAYSFVNSIAANAPEVRGVVVLWNGDQLETFAGNLDTRFPLLPAPNLNRTTS